MPQVAKSGSGSLFPLADFALDLFGLDLSGLAAAAFELAQVIIQVRHLVDHPLDFFGELLPLRAVERDGADGPGNLYSGASDPSAGLASQFLVAERNRIQLDGKLTQLFVQRFDVGQLLLDLVPSLGVSGAFDFKVAQIDKRVQVFDFFPDLL